MNAHMLHAHMQVFEWRKDAQAEDKHGANTVLLYTRLRNILTDAASRRSSRVLNSRSADQGTRPLARPTLFLSSTQEMSSSLVCVCEGVCVHVYVHACIHRDITHALSHALAYLPVHAWTLQVRVGKLDQIRERWHQEHWLLKDPQTKPKWHPPLVW